MANKLVCESYSDMVDNDENIILCRKIASKLWEIKAMLDESGISDNLTIDIASDETTGISFYNDDWMLTNHIETSDSDAINGDTGEVIHPIQYRQFRKRYHAKVVSIIPYEE